MCTRNVSPPIVPEVHEVPIPGEPVPGRPGLLLVSIGAPSIRDAVDSSRAELGLENADVLVDISTRYIEPGAHNWQAKAREIRNQIRSHTEDRAYGSLHLFYRGPVVLAPLIGALVVSVKPLVLYYLDENGRYAHAFTLDRRFLHEMD